MRRDVRSEDQRQEDHINDDPRLIAAVSARARIAFGVHPRTVDGCCSSGT